MGIFRQFPYSNFHDMNMDQIIKICRELQDAWAATSAEWVSYKKFIDNYFANLDVSEEVLAALRAMAASGELNTIIDPVIATATANWLNEHVTPTTPIVDNTLTIAGAAADAQATGVAIDSTDAYAENLANEKILISADFVRGSWTGNGSLDSKINYRSATRNKISFDHSITYSIEPGFRLRAIRFDKTTGTVISASPWVTDNYTFTDEFLYGVNIAKVDEDVSGIADVSEFISKVYWNRQGIDIVGIGTEAVTYSNLLANVDINARANIVASYGWLDTPTGNQAGMFTNHHYNSSYDLQTFVSHASGVEFNRIVKRSNREIYRDWKTGYPEYLDVVKSLKTLVLGDSIARGGRNSSKGFIGNIGLPLINMGVGGATVSNIYSTYLDSIHHFPDADNIPNQLTSYYNASAENIQTAFGIAKFTPDIIVAEGGINDYFKGSAIGTVPTEPITSDAEANLLDRSTLMGSLQYLFYNMVKLYHKAQRFFVITHKTYQVSQSRYCPVVVNSVGYNQQDLHDAIAQCCKIYDVKIIDIYNDSMLNTKFPEYRAVADSWHDAEADDYCDHDGIHPLAYGYDQAYVPIVRQSLNIGTIK